MLEPRRSRDINRDILSTDKNLSAWAFSAPDLSAVTPVSESALTSLTLFHGLVKIEQDK